MGLIIIIAILSVLVTGLSVALICQNRRLCRLQKWASQTYYDKNKLQLWIDRILHQQEKSVLESDETTIESK